MNWVIILAAFLGAFVLLLFLRFPVAMAFFVVNLVSLSFLVGFDKAGQLLVGSLVASVSKFSYTALPLFFLLGELLLKSGLSSRIIEVLNSMLGRIPGRLSVLTMLSGAVFGTLSGSGLANTSMLGRALFPEMHNRGYHTKMSIGPITAAGGLAILIPPSGLMVILGSIGQISIGGLFIAGIVPGLLLTAVFVTYIIIACKRNPDLAPTYAVEKPPTRVIVVQLAKAVGPVAFIFLAVIGSIFLGIATPTEAAALGVIAAVVAVSALGLMSVNLLQSSIWSATKATGIIFFIIAGASGYSQVLAFTGATGNLVRTVEGLSLPPLAIIVAMLLISLFLGMVLEAVPLMLITLPLFVPIVQDLGYSPIWFGILFLLMIDIGALTPPVGLFLFVMKSVVPEEIELPQIFYSVIPFITRELAFVGVLLLFPQIVLWLPNLMATGFR